MLRRYGRQSFTVEVIEECEDAEALVTAEDFWITAYDTLYPNGYNMVTGKRAPSEVTRARMSTVQKGHLCSLEQRAKLSAAHKGRKVGPPTEETRAKIRNALKGRSLSPEHRARLSAAHKGVPLSEEHRKSLGRVRQGKRITKPRPPVSEATRAKRSASMKGRKFGPRSEETRNKLREANRGKTPPNKGKKMPALTEEHRRQISESLKGRPKSEETKAKIKETKRLRRLNQVPQELAHSDSA